MGETRQARLELTFTRGPSVNLERVRHRDNDSPVSCAGRGPRQALALLLVRLVWATHDHSTIACGAGLEAQRGLCMTLGSVILHATGFTTGSASRTGRAATTSNATRMKRCLWSVSIKRPYRRRRLASCGTERASITARSS